MKSLLQFTAARKQLLANVAIAIVLISGLLLYKNTVPSVKPTDSVLEFKEVQSARPSVSLSEFDPNELDAKQWASLGFSERQVATILKYKNVVGGSFTSKQQFKKCYAVSEKKYAELEPYLLLPDRPAGVRYKTTGFTSYGSAPFVKKTLRIPGKFNPDHYNQEDWENLGFTAKQSAAILKYKSFLGGSFISKEKFRACFIISDENYARLHPYLLLPERAAAEIDPSQRYAGFPEKKENKTPLKTFDPNLMDLEGWKSLGFSEKQAQVILNYRDRILKGSFKNLEDIKKCFVISEEKFNELKPYIQLDPEHAGQKAASASVKTQSTGPKTDFTKVDLNKISYDQLTEFGFDDRAARSFIGFRNKLGGFASANQIFESYDIDRSLAEKLASTAALNTSQVEKYTLVDAPESWLKTHPYFRYSADKIIYYRLSYPDDRKIWKFIKVKPEYEAKMKLYLR